MPRALSSNWGRNMGNGRRGHQSASLKMVSFSAVCRVERLLLAALALLLVGPAYAQSDSTTQTDGASIVPPQPAPSELPPAPNIIPTPPSANTSASPPASNVPEGQWVYTGQYG